MSMKLPVLEAVGNRKDDEGGHDEVEVFFADVCTADLLHSDTYERV
jgi:hypothetical protein